MKYFLKILIFLSLQLALSQENTQKVSLSFDNSNLAEVLQLLENKTDYRFFYLEKWLEGKVVSGDFSDAPLKLVLDEIFDQTLINYYITDDYRIILTQNTVIHDRFPEDFFPRDQERLAIGAEMNDEEKLVPVFSNVEEPIDEIATVRIGREDRNRRERSFRITGVARNKGTGAPIPEMAVTVKGKNIGTTTNEAGFYGLEVPVGENVIETSALGIESSKTKVIVFNNGRLDFDLDEGLEVLDEVVVKADATRNIEQTVMGVTEVEIEKIKTIPLVLGERDMLKVATTMPGISTAGEGAAGFNVRGGRSDQNLILLDNSVIYNPTHFFGIFSALNPFTSSNINIYKGNIPAEFGGRLSSVFDVKTKDGNVEKLSGEASIGPVTGNLMLETPILKDRSSLLIGARATYSRWILRSLKEESLKNSRASFYDAIAKYHHRINENNDIRATGYYSSDAFNVTADSLFGYSNRLASLEWSHKFDNKNRASLFLANSIYKFNIQFEENSPGDFDLRYKIDETELKLKMKYLQGKGHNFDYGLSTKLYSVNPGTLEPLGQESNVEPNTISSERGWESALFVSDEYKPNEKLALNLGLRYSFFAALGESSQRIYENNAPKNQETLLETRQFEKNEIIETYGGLEARLGARYYLGTDFSIKASYNNTFQYIHTLSNNTTASPTDTWKLSDLNIEPQRANQVSLGFYKNLNDNLFELSLEGYYKKTKNILDYKIGAELLLNDAIETEVLQGKGKAYGVEFLAKKNEGRLNGWLGYTYSRSLVKFESSFDGESINNGKFFPSNFDKPHDISLVANYQLTKRFSFSTNFVYQTGRPVTFPVGSYVYKGEEFVYYSDRNKFRIPDYYRLDVSFNVEGNHKIKKFAHSFWNISVYNLLGRNNPYSVFFVTENGQVKAYQSSIFAVPIPTITYNFKF